MDSNRVVNVYIARDGAEIGDYQQDALEGLAREGQLQPTDYYWHEGMETWLELGDLLGTEAWDPPEPRPAGEPLAASEPLGEPKGVRTLEALIPRGPVARPRLIPIAAICAGLVVLATIAIYFIKSADSERANAPLLLGPSQPASRVVADPDSVRETAASDLRQRIERLPGKPVPPLHAFYYDVSVNMRKTYSAGVPWTAIIRGGENVIDPETEKTTLRTDFILTVDYREGEWTFQHYRASASDMLKSVTTEIEEDEKTPAPPSIVGMLGLKMKPR